MLPRARALVQRYRAQQLDASALYWADKALSLSGGALEDLVVYVQCLYVSKQYKRALHVLESNSLLQQSCTLKYLAAKCFAACKQWQNVLDMFTPSKCNSSPLGLKRFSEEGVKSYEVLSLGDLESATFILCAAAHNGLGDLNSATDCYKQALLVDVFCEEAIDKLCECHCLSAKEERNLLMSMPFKKQCTEVEEETLRALYQRKLSHTRSNVGIDAQLPKCIESLQDNADVLSDRADFYLDSMNIDACYRHTSHILEIDPYNHHALLLHIVCCVRKGIMDELFSLSHRLVNSFLDSPLSWYAVGCYYITVNKHQVARRYLNKSISLQATFAPSHMAFGISLALEGERDQARAAFAAAARIMQGSHLPLMFLGREYYLTGAVSTSTKFIKSALTISPHNPTLLQEVGVMLYNNGEYDKCENYFRLCLARLRSVDCSVVLSEWEPVYNNLGHVMRKVGKYKKAIQMHEISLQLSPNQPSTLSAIAFTYLLMRDLDKVIEFANKSLRLKREDQFTLELLHTAMEDAFRSVPDFSQNTTIEINTSMLLRK